MEPSTIMRQLWGDDWLPSSDQSPGEGDDTLLLGFFEDVMGRFPEQVRFIDRFPFVVESNEKYSEVAVFFDAALPKKVYRDEESRYKRVLQRVWAYSPVIVESDLSNRNVDYLSPVIGVNGRSRVKVLHRQFATAATESEFVSLTSWGDMEVLVELGLRERVRSVFVFTHFKLAIWTGHDLVMPLFLGDLSFETFIRTICTTEGLYLRDQNS